MSLGSLLGMKPVSMRNWMPYMPLSVIGRLTNACNSLVSV